jgi:hypothetical protein
MPVKAILSNSLTGSGFSTVRKGAICDRRFSTVGIASKFDIVVDGGEKSTRKATDFFCDYNNQR